MVSHWPSSSRISPASYFESTPLVISPAGARGPGGGPVKLRPKTFEMLRHFTANAGRLIGKEELMEAVWVAAEMRAGAAYAHAAIMLSSLSDKASE